MLRQLQSCALKGLVQSFIEGVCDTQALTGGLHLRAKADVCAADLLEGEYRHLDGNVISLLLQSRLVAKLF